MTELTLLRLTPNRTALAKWAVRQRQPSGIQDDGYVWHGLLRAVFGDAAPKPFVDRLDAGANEVLGYVRTFTPLQNVEPLAAQAAGLDRLQSNPMPMAWRAGRLLSFEVRARPIVRSRQTGPSVSPVELDAAIAARRTDPTITREQTYRQWLARELARDGAAELIRMRLAGFSRSRAVRRHGPQGGRSWGSVEGPDAWLRGVLQIADPERFGTLLARGVGRHRSYGFGCLLVAPAGVLD